MLHSGTFRKSMSYTQYHYLHHNQFFMRTENPDILHVPRINLKGRALHDLEVMLVGGFAPVMGFMGKEDYESVVREVRLENGSLFPIPIVLDVPKASSYQVGDRVLLCDSFGNPLATMDITSRYTPDKDAEVLGVFGTNDRMHPGVQYVLDEMHEDYIGGTLTQIALPERNDFKQFRKTPAELKALFKERGWNEVVGFQTRNPMHRAHFELVKRAHEKTGAPVLVHPVVGMTKPGDIDYVTRVRTYDVVCNTYGRISPSSHSCHLRCVWRARVRRCGMQLFGRIMGVRTSLWGAITRAQAREVMERIFMGRMMRAIWWSSMQTKWGL